MMIDLKGFFLINLKDHKLFFYNYNPLRPYIKINTLIKMIKEEI